VAGALGHEASSKHHFWVPHTVALVAL
jgi:hypothetical protein